jgi:hypothetical protein
MADGWPVRTEVASRRCIRTDTLKAKCGGERIGCRAKQSCQSFHVLGRFGLPGSDEIAAGPELAQRFGFWFCIWSHSCRSGFQKLAQFRSIASVVSAGRADLPKQKPNKNKPLQDFFFALRFLF